MTGNLKRWEKIYVIDSGSIGLKIRDLNKNKTNPYPWQPAQWQIYRPESDDSLWAKVKM